MRDGMSSTEQLLALYRVDQHLRNLRSRLTQAERFLVQQRTQLDGIDTRHGELAKQAKQLRASISNEEGEASRLEERITALREQMNSAKTAKEYTAFQSELNNLKQQKGEVETRVLEQMGRLEEVQAQIDAIESQKNEREGIVKGAASERDARDAEIRERVQELMAEREKLAAAIPVTLRVEFEAYIEVHGDDAMASVEILDQRSMECSCGSCMMTLPVESVSAMLSGKLTRCPTCRAYLYSEKQLMPNKKKGSKQAAEVGD